MDILVITGDEIIPASFSEKSKIYLTHLSAFHAQQAIEKSFKAIVEESHCYCSKKLGSRSEPGSGGF